MIRYQLRCDHDHHFEAWFLDGATYDAQAASGDVSCPHCGDSRISKAPMAPNIATRGARSIDGKATEAPADDRAAEVRANEVAERILEAVDGLRRHVEENFDYVGDDFTDEARRIHSGKAEARDIWGEATREDAGELEDDGIEVVPLPSGRRRN